MKSKGGRGIRMMSDRLVDEMGAVWTACASLERDDAVDLLQLGSPARVLHHDRATRQVLELDRGGALALLAASTGRLVPGEVVARTFECGERVVLVITELD